MDNFFDMLQKLLPNVDEQMYSRLVMLKVIAQYQPIGRRALAERLNISERALRQAVDELKTTGMIAVQHVGMTITPSGNYVLQYFDDLATEKEQLADKSQRLREKLQIDQAYVSAGNIKEDSKQVNLIGKAVSRLLDQNLPQGKNVIAVMGGTSVATVANNLSPQLGKDRQLLFISGRGGMGSDATIQANVICDKMAHMTNGESQALYTLDQMSVAAYDTLVNEPSISETLQSIQQANALIFGIGDANTMISRRNFDDDLAAALRKKKVVGEAFGEYYTASGEVVYRLKRIGLQIEDLAHIPLVIAVAYGEDKAVAIEAFMKLAPAHLQLVTDEGVANKILH